MAHVTAELEAMIADDLVEVIAKLEGLANLRQLPSKVVANAKAAVQLQERHAFHFGRIGQPRMDAAIRRVGRAGGTSRVNAGGIAHASKTKRGHRAGAAGVLNLVGF